MTSRSQAAVIRFIEKQIIYRFGILETITVDQGIMFIGDKVTSFVQEYGIKLIYSSPYYTQSNG